MANASEVACTDRDLFTIDTTGDLSLTKRRKFIAKAEPHTPVERFAPPCKSRPSLKKKVPSRSAPAPKSKPKLSDLWRNSSNQEPPQEKRQHQGPPLPQPEASYRLSVEEHQRLLEVKQAILSEDREREEELLRQAKLPVCRFLQDDSMIRRANDEFLGGRTSTACETQPQLETEDTALIRREQRKKRTEKARRGEAKDLAMRKAARERRSQISLNLQADSIDLTQMLNEKQRPKKKQPSPRKIPPIDCVPDSIPDTLRALVPIGSNLQDRFQSLQDRGLIEKGKQKN